MNIYYISHSKIPSSFANSVHVMKMCQAFALNGHRVTLFAKTGSPECPDDFAYYGVRDIFNIEKIPFTGQRIIAAFSYIKGVIRQVKTMPKPDIIYSRYLFCTRFLLQISVPVYLEAHQRPQNTAEFLLFKQLFRHKNFKRLIVISRLLGKDYLKIFPELSKKQLTVAQDGADPMGDRRTLPTLENWPGRAERLQVGYIGSLYRGRGVELILSLAQRLPDYDFHVIGGNPEEVAAWEKQQRQTSNVFFHGYIKPFLGDTYRDKMDILVAPYQKRVAVAGNKGNTVDYMSPLKIFEYMAAGKAIVASDLPAIREIIESGEDGLLAAPDDLASWEDHLRLLNDADRRAVLGERAQKKLLARYTWQTRAENVIKNENNVT